MSDIWRGEKSRYDLVGQVGDDGRVWVGEQRKYDLAGEVDDEGNVWRGEKSGYDLVGQVGDDGRVWFGELRKYDLAGEVDDEGNIWRGEKTRYDLAGQVDPPSQRYGAAGLLLLLGEERKDLRDEATRVVREAAVATAVGLAVDVAATLLNPDRRHARRVQKKLRDLVDREGPEIQRAERLLATGQQLEAGAASSAVVTRLNERIRAETDPDVLPRLRLMRAWAASVPVRAQPEAERPQGAELLDELSSLSQEISPADVGLRQEAAKLQVVLASALRLPELAVTAGEELCRLLPGDRTYRDALAATRVWAEAAERQKRAGAAEQAVEDVAAAVRALHDLNQRHIDETSETQQPPDGTSEAESLLWARDALALQEDQVRRVAGGVERLESATEALRSLRRSASGELARLIDEAMESGERTLEMSKEDLSRRGPVIDGLRRIVEPRAPSSANEIASEVGRLRESADNGQRVLSDLQAELQRAVSVFSGQPTRSEAVAAQDTLVRQMDRLRDLEDQMRADLSAWDALPIDGDDPARALLQGQIETFSALKGGLQGIIERVGRALEGPGSPS